MSGYDWHALQEAGTAEGDKGTFSNKIELKWHISKVKYSPGASGQDGCANGLPLMLHCPLIKWRVGGLRRRRKT